MRRLLSFLMLAVVAIFCIAVATVYLSISSVIATTIEKYGSAISGTTVKLKDADFSPTSGETSITGLTVGTPPGFTAEPAFFAPTVNILIDPQTLGHDAIVIRRLEMVAPEITYEVRNGNDSLRALRRNIETAAAKERNGPLIQTLPDQTTAAKFIIEDLYIKKAVVIVEADQLSGRRATALLDDIYLKDIGREEGGLPPAEIVRRIHAALLRETSRALLSTDLALSEQIINLLRSASDEAEEILRRLNKLLEK